MKKITALVWDEGRAYFFLGSQYARYDIVPDRAAEDYPKTISSVWPGMFAEDIDAAVVWPNGKAFFFRRGEYLRYDITHDRVDEGYPKPISSGWPGVFSQGIDAVVVWNNGKAYFFRGKEYIRYDIEKDRADEGYPKPISSGWKGVFPEGISSAVLWPNGKAYFFRGDSYSRYDPSSDAVDPGYPAAMSAWGLPFGGATPSAVVDSDFRKRCAALLEKHEGRRNHMYLDTLNIPSIGIGFNLKRGGARQALSSVGADYDQVLAGNQDLTDTQVDALFSKDLDGALAGARRQVPNFDSLATNARLVVVDMMFMGEAAFAKFKKMIAALQKFDYNTAADEMKDSKWYSQVKLRGIEDVELMRAAAG
jgi:GH24 family phage-related lysozyme (muramidase)